MTARASRAELLWVMSGQVLTLLLGVFTLKMLTYLLGPQDYGQFALGLSVAGTLNMFIYGPMSHAVSRYFHLCSQEGRLGEYEYLVAFLLRSIALAILVVGGVAALWMMGDNNHDWTALVIMAIGYGIAAGTLSIYLADLNTRRQRRAYALLQSVDAMLRLAGAVMITLLVGAKASLAMGGFLVGSLISLVIARYSLRAVSLPLPQSQCQLFGINAIGRKFVGYSSSISLFAIPAIFASYGDRWIIQQTMSDAHVGIYVAIAQIANAPANLVLSVFSQTLNPILFQRAGNSMSPAAMRDSRRLLYRAVLPLTFMLVIVCGVSFLFGKWIVMTLTSADFAPYSDLLWMLVLAAAIFQIGQALTAEVFMYNRPFLLFGPKLAHAVVFLGLSFWLVGNRQLEGVAIAAVAASVVYLPLVVRTNIRAGKATTPIATPHSKIDEL